MNKKIMLKARMVAGAVLLVGVWFHVHWTVAIVITLLGINAEMVAWHLWGGE